MSILQFLGIIWAHRLLIVGAALLCFTVGAVTVNVVQPRYEAQSRVMLDVLKPDPVTGQVIASAFMKAYTTTQKEMVKDQEVARQVVRDLNWANNPIMMEAYRNRETGKELDFEHWAAQMVIDNTEVDLIMGTNIMEIRHSSYSPERAKRVADGLLKAYIDRTLQNRRETARRNAEWYEAQAEKSRSILFAAEKAKADLERQSGIVLQEDRTDLDTTRLRALASQGAAPVINPGLAAQSQTAANLATLDAEIAEASKTLGPNHPGLLAAKRRRELMAQQLAQERNSAAAAASAAMSAAGATSGMLEQQKAKVMAQREQVERLRLMQDEIDLRRDQYNKAVARAAQLRQEAEIANAGVTPLANAITPTSPVFPKKGLVMGAAIPVGAALGLVLALILELVGRRVRSADDLNAASGAPVLAVVHNPQNRKRASLDLRRFLPASRRRGAARPVRA